MPNHCSNSVTIEGPVATIREIASKLKTLPNDQKEFDFEAYIPFPDDLKGIVASRPPYRMFVNGTQVFENEIMSVVDSAGNVFKRDEVEIENRDLSEEEQQDLYEKHGACTWYQWYNNTVGTKWGYYEQCVDVDIEGGYIHIYADSAWSPAIEGLTNFSEIYPDVTITNHYAEQGVGYMGTTVIQGGEAEDTFSYEGDFYQECPEGMDEDEWWDSMDEDRMVPKVAEFLEKHGLHTGG